MSCCGQRRAAARTQSHPAQPVRRAPQLRRPVQLAHTGAGPIVVRGAHTGLTYAFAAASAPLAVDERDVAGLLATGAFVRAS